MNTTRTTGGSSEASPAAQYGVDGFVVIRNVFSAEDVAELDAESWRLLARRDLIDSNNLRCRWQNHCDSGECRFDCFDPVIDLSPACARVARDQRILDEVSALYSEHACLFKDKLIFKMPGAASCSAVSRPNSVLTTRSSSSTTRRWSYR